MELYRTEFGVEIRRPGVEPLPIRHIIGIGRNYAAHAHEQKADVPDRPMIFTKNPASAILNEQHIVIPRICTDRELCGGESHGDHEQVDYEGELGVILGRSARDVQPRQVADPGSGIILGYVCANDVSARWWQKQGAGGQFCRGKSFDTFCPIGPRIATPHEIPDPQALHVETRLGGEVMQSAPTSQMIFPVFELIAELSRGTTLLPGTLILTGTPEGVGMARNPQRFLRDGDIVEIEIQPIGILKNEVSGGLDCGVDDRLGLGPGRWA